jgi:hypothetical protein
MSYIELQATSHFSFLRGVSSAEELFIAACELGIPAPFRGRVSALRPGDNARAFRR